MCIKLAPRSSSHDEKDSKDDMSETEILLDIPGEMDIQDFKRGMEDVIP